MLHQANANFPATDTVSNRAPNTQLPLKSNCIDAPDLKDKTQSHKQIEISNRKGAHDSLSSHGLFYFSTFF